MGIGAVLVGKETTTKLHSNQGCFLLRLQPETSTIVASGWESLVRIWTIFATRQPQLLGIECWQNIDDKLRRTLTKALPLAPSEDNARIVYGFIPRAAHCWVQTAIDILYQYIIKQWFPQMCAW